MEKCDKCKRQKSDVQWYDMDDDRLPENTDGGNN